MSDLSLPDDLTQWQDALEDRDNAKHAYQSYTGNDMRGAAVLCEVWLDAANRVEKLRMEHLATEPAKTSSLAASIRDLDALEIGSLEESESPDLVTGTYGIYSEDEYFDNRERLRGIK